MPTMFEPTTILRMRAYSTSESLLLGSDAMLKVALRPPFSPPQPCALPLRAPGRRAPHVVLPATESESWFRPGDDPWRLGVSTVHDAVEVRGHHDHRLHIAGPSSWDDLSEIARGGVR